MGAKSWVRRLASPVTRRVYFRVDRQLDARLRDPSHPIPVQVAELRAQIDDIRAEVERTISTVLNAMSTQNADARLQERFISQYRYRIEALEQRLEQIREEIMLEVRYGDRSEPAPAATEPRILRPERLRDFGDKIRLNLGAGYGQLPDYLNVDGRALDGIDIVADALNLPFGPGSVTEIRSAHFLEHFPVEMLRRTLLPYLVSLLVEGGTFVAIVPDMVTMIEKCASGDLSREDFLKATYGGQEYDGDSHYAGFSPESLGALLEEAGLTGFRVRESGRRNGICYEMEVEAFLPSASA